MKKKNSKFLRLKKSTITKLDKGNINGGGSWGCSWICTFVCSDGCEPTNPNPNPPNSEK